MRKECSIFRFTIERRGRVQWLLNSSTASFWWDEKKREEDVNGLITFVIIIIILLLLLLSWLISSLLLQLLLLNSIWKPGGLSGYIPDDGSSRKSSFRKLLCQAFVSSRRINHLCTSNFHVTRNSTHPLKARLLQFDSGQFEQSWTHRLIYGGRSSDHITPLLINLHWQWSSCRQTSIELPPLLLLMYTRLTSSFVWWSPCFVRSYRVLVSLQRPVFLYCRFTPLKCAKALQMHWNCQSIYHR